MEAPAAPKSYFKAQELTPFLSSPLGKKLGLNLDPPCVYTTPINEYMNNATVRQSLHIPESAPMWQMCNGTMNENWVKDPKGSIDIWVALKGKYKMLKYSGDTDMAVPTYGTRDWINNLAWPITKGYKQFFVDQQVGGYVEYREGGAMGNFTFATIHGAGHMAPQWRRGPTYHVIFNFINNKPI